MAKVYGELSCYNVTWKIPRFMKVPLKNNYWLKSPAFSFANATWQLQLQLDDSETHEHDNIDIFFQRLSSTIPEQDVSYRFGYKIRSGKKYKCVKGEYCFVCDYAWVKGYSLKISELHERSDELLPDGILTVFCDINLTELGGVETLLTGLEQTSPVVHESSFIKEEQIKSLSVKKLQSDYKTLLEGSKETDVCLVVSGKEFPAHRCILRSRSTVFEDMFNHDTKEKISGKVDIEDLDPDSFQDFLEYVYTGCAEMLSDKNVVGLYTAAEKYDIQTLKSECLEYMERNLSVDSFCDIITLALNYHETNLMNLAIDFFKKNLTKIIVTVKWQLFMSNNSTRANELLITALVPSENKQCL